MYGRHLLCSNKFLTLHTVHSGCVQKHTIFLKCLQHDVMEQHFYSLPQQVNQNEVKKKLQMDEKKSNLIEIKGFNSGDTKITILLTLLLSKYL